MDGKQKQDNLDMWQANVAAFFELAGLDPKKFPSKTATFYAGSTTATGIKGNLIGAGTSSTTLKESAITKDPDGPDADFNAQVYAIADALPSIGSPYYTNSGSLRIKGIEQYLQNVDPGEAPDQNAMDIYLADKASYETAQHDYDTKVAQAQKEYKTSGSKLSFEDWVKKVYAYGTALKQQEKSVNRLRGAVDTDMRNAFGPRSLALQEYRDAIADVLDPEATEVHPGLTMWCNSAIQPYYAIGSRAFNAKYSEWVKNKSKDPEKVVELKKQSYDSSKWSQYGHTKESAEGFVSLFAEEPFFFFGEGSYSKSEEKWSMYNATSYKSLKVRLTAMGAPQRFPITPGHGWFQGDPSTPFPPSTLVDNHPDNVDNLIHPFVTEVIIGSGVGYQIELDKEAFEQFESFIKKDSSNQVVGIFGIFFEGGRTESSEETGHFGRMQLDSNKHTITFNPRKTTSTVNVGVIASKGQGGSHALIDGEAINSGTIAPLPAGVNGGAFADELDRFIDALSTERRMILGAAIEKLFRGAAGAHEGLLQSLCEPPASERQSDKVEFTHKCGRSSISITVQSNSTTAEIENENGFELSFSEATCQFLRVLNARIHAASVAHRMKDTHGYLEAVNQLGELVTPIVRTLTKATSMRAPPSLSTALVDRSARLLTDLGTRKRSSANLFVPQTTLDEGTLAVSAAHPQRWDGTTTKAVDLGVQRMYRITFYNDDGDIITEGPSAADIRARNGGQSMTIPVTLGPGYVYWFQGSATNDVTLSMSIRLGGIWPPPRGVAFELVEV